MSVIGQPYQDDDDPDRIGDLLVTVAAMRRALKVATEDRDHYRREAGRLRSRLADRRPA